MNCYLSWNLKDMTNISAEKLQKNISQQASYIQLYRSELTKEAYKFNIGSLLRHICTERASFGTEPIQKRATDCLVVFLHAAAFQKVTYFAPTDAENPAVAKCARNLHRLMLENVKSTMRFIDYEVLQKHARGEIDTDELFSERRRIHEAVFPDDNLITISKNDGLNDEFLKLIDMETQKARVFVDFDVQRNTSIPTELCQKLASVPRSEAALPDSRYGLIGSCKSSLATPFIKYGNSYYSFVTAYSLNEIAPIVDKFADSIPVVTEPEPAPEPEPVAEPEPIVEPVIESEPEPVSEPEPEPEAEPVEEESHAEEPEAVEEIVEEQPEQEEETPEDTEDVEPEDKEPEESVEAEEPEEAPQDIEEEDDIPFDEPEETYYEPEMSEASEEEEDDDEPEIVQTEVEEPVLEQSPSEEDEDEEENPEDDPFEDDDDDLIEEAPAEYSALVSPDAYDYLNQASKSDFKEDPMLEEQDHGAWYDDEDEDDELPPEDDEPDPYDGESLFSIMDDSEEDEEPVKEEPVEEPEPTSESPFIAEDEEEDSPAEPEPIVRFVEPEPQPEAEEPVAEEEPETEEAAESEPEAEPEAESEEPEAEPEPEPEPEPQVKPAEDQTLPLLDQILRCAPSKNNPIVQYLTSCPFEQKKEIVRFIELARKAWLIDGKDKMFSIPDTTISVAVFSETQDPMLNIQRRENIGAVMFASQKDSWNSLELSYDGSGQFVKADYVRISRNSYTDWEWKIVEKLGTRLMERRAK